MKEWIINSSNLIFSTLFHKDSLMYLGNLGYKIHQTLSKRIISKEHILQKSHTTQQHPMSFLFQTMWYFWQELCNIFWWFFDDLYACKDSFLTNNTIIVVYTLHHHSYITFKTSLWSYLLSCTVHISLSTHNASPTMLRLGLIRSTLILLVAIINNYD